jgi:hypothetical protein
MTTGQGLSAGRLSAMGGLFFCGTPSKWFGVNDRKPPAPARAHQKARAQPTADPPSALGR